MRVLLVEDNDLLGRCLQSGLEANRYVVDWLKDGASAWHAIQTENFDVIILDLGLPKMSGEEILKNTRARGINTPVVILTARDATDDRVQNLNTGADDYVIKPFDLDELCARIRSIQRRTMARAEPTIKYEDISLDPSTRIVYKAGQPLELSRREFVLLQLLLENAGRVLSREKINQSLYGWGDDIDSNALEVHIHNLRKKVGTAAISTIRGVGYILGKKKIIKPV